MILNLIVDFYRTMKFCDRHAKSQDRWASELCCLSPRVFGRGSKRPFSWYLQGPSQKIETIDDMTTILVEKFRYKSDMELFKKADKWQHPSDFEGLCDGDCEDHALWAWRKLIEINMPAQFIVGCILNKESKLRGHAWVIFKNDEHNFLLESCWKDKQAMIMEIGSEYINSHYFPFFGIDGGLNTYIFSGIAIIVERYGFKELKGLMS